MPGPIDEKVWTRAKQTFVKSYNKLPKTPSDYRIIMSIYKDMGGKVKGPETKSVAQKLFGKLR